MIYVAGVNRLDERSISVDKLCIRIQQVDIPWGTVILSYYRSTVTSHITIPLTKQGVLCNWNSGLTDLTRSNLLQLFYEIILRFPRSSRLKLSSHRLTIVRRHATRPICICLSTGFSADSVRQYLSPETVRMTDNCR